MYRPVEMPIASSALVQFGGATSKSVRIQHREFVQSIGTTTGFSLVAVNPGISAIFPWLSVQAQCWEKYKFHKLRFVYVPRCSTGVAGALDMAFDYDAQDSVPATEGVLLNYDGATTGPPWMPFAINVSPVKMDEFAKFRYIRSGILPTSSDVKTYDVGNFLTYQFNPASVAFGMVFVEYDVELSVQAAPPAGLGTSTVLVDDVGTNNTTPAGTLATYSAFGNSLPLAPSSDGTSFTFSGWPVGRFVQLAYNFVTSSRGMTGGLSTTPVGLTLNHPLDGVSGSYITADAGAGVPATASGIYSIDAASGTIPVIGNYDGAAANTMSAIASFAPPGVVW